LQGALTRGRLARIDELLEHGMASHYDVRREDDGTWTVYDRATDLPAVINDIPQVGHDEEDARQIARELDELTDDDED
jgi:hypothetical protein